MTNTFEKWVQADDNSNSRGAIRDIQLAAADRYNQLPMPSVTQESWRFTNPADILATTWNSPAVSMPEIDRNAGLPLNRSHRLIMINGLYSEAHSAAAIHGITVCSLTEAATKHPELISRSLNKFAGRDNPFTVMNAAVMSDGLFIRIPASTVVEDPIHIVHHAAGKIGSMAIHPRVLILLEANAQATILENYICGDAEEYLVNSVTEVTLGSGANLGHYRLQEDHLRASHLSTLAVHLDNNSNYHGGIFDLGGKLTRNDIAITLDGEGANCELNGLHLLSGSRHLDNHTVIHHARPNCTSHELFKGILSDRSRGVFNGLIKVAEGANGTDSVQTNRNLLLSDQARVNSNPQLEIYTDEVKCSHGSATGKLDEDALFYFRSRGISLKDAYRIMVAGFANEVLDRITLTELTDCLNERIARQLHSLDEG